MVLSARGLVARHRRSGGVSALAGVLLGLLLALAPGTAQAQAPPTPVMCGGGNQLPVQGLLMRPDGLQPDLIVNGVCNANMGQNGLKPTAFYYGNVYILSGGNLHFEQPTDITQNPDIDFWASSIVVEANGTLQAGVTAAYGDPMARRDQWGGFLTIYLYGANQSVKDGMAQDPGAVPGQGVLCMANPAAGAGPCGIPADVWNDNGKTLFPGCGTATVAPDSKCIPGLPTAAKDYFYQYGPLYGDDLCSDGKTKWTPATGCGSGPPVPEVGYFGYKVLAVSYGGTLNLRGYKGSPSCPPLPALCPILLRTSSGNSWMRLNGDLNPGAPILTVDGAPGNRWFLSTDAQNGHADEIVVTATDYLPDHSEKLTLAPTNGAQGGKITLAPTPAVKWFHRGTRYPIALGAAKDRLETTGMDPNLVSSGAETRAAVALLTRNIRIVSAGDKAGETFAQAADRTLCPDKVTKGCYYFGGHTIFRQGIGQVQVQGVEFAQLGQGGKIGHYPIHFHKTRQVPPGTYVDDSAVNESNTRWYVLHSTQGVTFQRDVGWESIGHGYYLEDGTEADNNFYSDIGIFARAAIANPDNPRMVPGILADNQDPASFTKANPANVANPGFVYRSDNEYPTVFWISNGWNNFQGDMAAGAGACGSAYWFVPMANTDAPDVPTADNVYVEPDGGPKTTHMKWADGGVETDGTVHFGYAGLQRLPLWAASTPLESFYMNYATSTMMSFQTTGDAPACEGFAAADAAKSNPPTVPFLAEVASFAPKPKRALLPPPNPNNGEGPDLVNDPFYPHAIGLRQATRCAVSKFQVAGLPTRYDCTPPKPGFAGLRTPCTDSTDFLVHNPGMLDDPNNPEISCGPTVIDHFTSSFHWAQGDVSAMWLRPQWYLVTNSVLSDVQQGGITFVTGGDVFRSSIITGYWGLLRNSILVGHTQPQDAAHRFALDIGPFNSFTALPYKCEKATGSDLPSYCLNKTAGVSLPLTGFFNNQRLENIYDGPSYRDSNAYLDVTKTGCPVGDFNTAVDTCIYGTKQTSGVLKNPGGMPDCYVPNAAIAWKQPNGFFYPPAFHADNLYFGDVDIRHFVIDPLFKAFDGSTSPFADPNSQDFGQGGSYIGDGDAVNAVYCLPPGLNTKLYFNGYTSIDRQTELNDDDGSLTGLSNDIQPTLMPPNPLKQTISVNEDDFFTAPVETPECASNIGNNVMPDNACMSPVRAAPTVTAKTSPYDYVSTVIYHLPNTDLNPADRWDADCTNPTCYGVPLYRQFLAGNPGGAGIEPTREWRHWLANGCNTDPATFGITKACRWPFIRMAGTAKSTRETLTVNNGTYYLDTTVPLNMQLSEVYNTSGDNGATQNVSANPFLANETYDVFFVYAKPTTRQTYLVYLGKNATAANVKPIQFRLDTMQVTSLAAQPWLTADDKQTGTTGILTVTVDFTKLTGDSLETLPKNGLCQPRTFCTGTGTTCVSALKDTDPLVIANPNIKQQADAVCGQWAVKDLDCPPTGCYGFSFTIPSTGFVAGATIDNPSPNRPAPVPFPTDATDQGSPTWLVRFLQTTVPPDNATGGECHYTTLPTYPPPRMGECTVPDWVPQ